MKKIMIIIISSVITILLVTGGLLLLKSIDESKKEIKTIEEKIVSSYQTFREKVESFNGERKIYSNQVGSDLFKESSYKYDEWIKVIDEYTVKIKEVEQSSSYLKDKCIDHVYKKQDVKNKCDAFIIAYETAFNYYVKDITNFNNNISSFNEELEENKKLKEYKLDYKYIDINNDGKFYGKD